MKRAARPQEGKCDRKIKERGGVQARLSAENTQCRRVGRPIRRVSTEEVVPVLTIRILDQGARKGGYRKHSNKGIGGNGVEKEDQHVEERKAGKGENLDQVTDGFQ